MDGQPFTGTQVGLTSNEIASAVIANLVVLLRILVRKFVVKSLGWDDVCILLALLAKNVGTALVLVEVHYGLGLHRAEIPVATYDEFMFYGYLEWIQTFQTLMFTKIAICLLLLRIVISRSFVYTLWTGIGLLIFSNLVLTILWIVQCKPVWLAWNPPEVSQPGSCFTTAQLSDIILAQAIVSILSDVVLAAYPVFIVRKLRMSMRRKVGLCILMGLGVITAGLCIARTVLNWQNTATDGTWAVIPNYYLRSWEVCIGIVISCLPALHPGYKKIRDRVHGRTLSDSDKSGSKSKNVEKLLSPSTPFRFSPRSRIPRDSSSLPGEATKPLPAIPPNTLRRDLRSERTRTGQEVSHDDSIYLPIQDSWAPGITKTMEVDLESQRVLSNDESEQNGPQSVAWDSRTALQGEAGWKEPQ